MPEQAKYNNNLKIIRPFLSLEKKDLKYVTLNYFKTYIKDPSLMIKRQKQIINQMKNQLQKRAQKRIKKQNQKNKLSYF